MAFLSQAVMRARGAQVLAQQELRGKTARSFLAEATTFDPSTTYDIFLSHSIRDKALVTGVIDRLKRSGFTVYVDWIDDAQLDRTAVTPENAERLRARMRHCRSLLYLATDNASRSKWMPWEVGFFDGLDQGEIGILPVLDDPQEDFEGMEFLGLYTLAEFRTTKPGYSALFMERTDGDAVRLKSLLRKVD
jgi:hypothetical protein